MELCKLAVFCIKQFDELVVTFQTDFRKVVRKFLEDKMRLEYNTYWYFVSL